MYSLKLTPVLTEKSLNQAKNGIYTFIVDFHLDKAEIKSLIEKTFDVHVSSIKTMNYKKGERKNSKGRKETIKAYKKTMVSLKDKEKIEIFETKKK